MFAFVGVRCSVHGDYPVLGHFDAEEVEAEAESFGDGAL